jgi:hypothetical protein
LYLNLEEPGPEIIMAFDAYHTPRILRGRYSVATQGGAAAPTTHNLVSEDLVGICQLPDNTIVFGCWYETRTAITSGGAAQIALQIAAGGGTNILPADTIANNFMDVAGAIQAPFTGAGITQLAVMDPVRNASGAPTNVQMIASVAALLTGVVDFYLLYCYANTR